MSHVVILTLGTRGDLHPFRCLARHLALSSWVGHISIAAPHGECVDLTDERSSGAAPIMYVPVMTAEATTKRCRDAEERNERNRGHFDECMYLCMDADLIVFNLFSLVGWHIAHYRGVPSVAASPYLIPYSHPDSFPRRFRDAHPELHALLNESHEGKIGWGEVGAWFRCPCRVLTCTPGPGVTLDVANVSREICLLEGGVATWAPLGTTPAPLAELL